jgi:hypothetical protein
MGKRQSEALSFFALSRKRESKQLYFPVNRSHFFASRKEKSFAFTFLEATAFKINLLIFFHLSEAFFASRKEKSFALTFLEAKN